MNTKEIQGRVAALADKAESIGISVIKTYDAYANKDSVIDSKIAGNIYRTCEYFFQYVNGYCDIYFDEQDIILKVSDGRRKWEGTKETNPNWDKLQDIEISLSNDRELPDELTEELLNDIDKILDTAAWRIRKGYDDSATSGNDIGIYEDFLPLVEEGLKAYGDKFTAKISTGRYAYQSKGDSFSCISINRTDESNAFPCSRLLRIQPIYSSKSDNMYSLLAEHSIRGTYEVEFDIENADETAEAIEEGLKFICKSYK